MTVLVRGPELTASKVAREKLPTYPNVTIRLNAEVASFEGNGRLAAVRVRDIGSGAEESLPVAAAFVFIGLSPNTGFLQGIVNLDAHGFISTTDTMATNIPGVFAAGDCRHGSTKQIASAVGEGATAAIMIRSYLAMGEQSRGGGED